MKFYKYNGRCNACGAIVRTLREERGLSQEQLAAKLQCEGINLAQKAVSRIELGSRVVADFELVALARIFGVTLDALLSDTQPT
ncbi:hypothetical protein FACS1894217_07370 [Clostridia bacterium]|nr:hypothetical protein FACS1894217_07370 [Clostridia bacterium]